MNETLHRQLMAYPGVEHEFKPAWEMDLYRVGGKIFAQIGADKANRPLLTMKLEPAFSDLLRSQYPGQIVPGYYCNKVHWSSLYLGSPVPEDVVKAMMDDAYHTVFASLTKKAQAEIESAAASIGTGH